MEQIVLNTGGTPEITITSAAGDLRLLGWEQNVFSAEAAHRSDLTADQQDDRRFVEIIR